ncbi:MAG: hypothetical protein IT371_00170 [Deltaproteobacteria bacterium]|nr:hypothetical protein [Deltaproteobacteria bacterium]
MSQAAGKTLRQRLVALLPLVLVAAVLFVAWWWAGPRLTWQTAPTLNLRVLLVDYTVPFDDYKEHLAATWLLNHAKVPSPVPGKLWDVARDYVGYYPDRRRQPVRLAQLPALDAHLIFITDTYGVYRDDLKDVAKKQAHMDYNPVVFGGLSVEDARRLDVYARAGGHLITEFNSFCDPTPEPARRLMERVLGVRWTGWVGRVFADPHDRGDVPYWLAREFAAQYPGVELPRYPVLVLVHRDGRLRLYPARSEIDAAPKIRVTEDGRRAFGELTQDVPFYYWFAVLEAEPKTTVHAELQLPPLAGLHADAARLGIPSAFPVLTERVQGASRRVNFGGDLVDVDFPLPKHSVANIVATRAQMFEDRGAVSTEPHFYRFFAPVLLELLRQMAAGRAAAR